MDIKYGDIEYFTLLDLRDKLKYFQYDKLDLVNLDKLRIEVAIKIEAIHLKSKDNGE
jgi:hypothetical protein